MNETAYLIFDCKFNIFCFASRRSSSTFRSFLFALSLLGVLFSTASLPLLPARRTGSLEGVDDILSCIISCKSRGEPVLMLGFDKLAKHDDHKTATKDRYASNFNFQFTNLSFSDNYRNPIALLFFQICFSPSWHCREHRNFFCKRASKTTGK